MHQKSRIFGPRVPGRGHRGPLGHRPIRFPARPPILRTGPADSRHL